MNAGYVLAFTTGLLGGFGHCIGMCGPVVASYSIHTPVYKQNTKPLFAGLILPHLLYNTGRITTYSCIGAMMGLSGSFLKVAARISGLQDAIAIAAGLLMILMGLSVSGLLHFTAYIEKHNVFILKAVRVVLEGESSWRYYPLGILLGFMPCGLSYSAFIASAAAGGILQGMFLSFCFGMGTLPALLAFGSAVSYISAGVRRRIYRIGGIAIIAMGIYFLYRGIVAHA
jgi:sulfite exporter TauE/SafE